MFNLSKTQIEKEKGTGNQDFFRAVLKPSNDDRTILFALENLGRLPNGFDSSLLIPLLKHPNADIRLNAIKNLGKVKDESLLAQIMQLYRCEQNTLVRREIVSAIGRLRTQRAIRFLEECLHDEDPKIVLQAIRALLYFKDDSSVRASLLKLSAHPNELIQSAIQREFSSPQHRQRANL